jgi:alkylhydroperoxidase family enzyme
VNGRPGPRVTPLPTQQWDQSVYRALAVLLPADRLNPADAGTILSTLARHPKLAEAYLHFNAYVLTGSTLSARVREVAILRTVVHRECPYLWDHHIPLALRAGLTVHDVDGVSRGQVSDELDAAIVAAVDELDEHSTITSPTWRRLAGHLDERQRMDLVFAVGAYALLAAVVNSFGIQDEHLG